MRRHNDVAHIEPRTAGQQFDPHFGTERERLRRGDGDGPELAPSPPSRSTLTSTMPAISSKRSTAVAITAQPGQHPAGADIGMAGERHLAGAIEDTHPGGVRRVFGRNDEGRLAEIELRGERLHFAVGQAAGVRKDASGLPPKRRSVKTVVRSQTNRYALPVATRPPRPISAAMRRRPAIERAVALRPSCGQCVSMLAKTSSVSTPPSRRLSSPATARCRRLAGRCGLPPDRGP